MSKFTPGPWRIGTDIRGRNYNANMIQCGPNDYTADTIASVYGIAQNRGLDELSSDPRWDLGIANARLIAAAPEMYAELAHLCDLLDAAFDQGISIPGLATTNKARALLARIGE